MLALSVVTLCSTCCVLALLPMLGNNVVHRKFASKRQDSLLNQLAWSVLGIDSVRLEKLERLHLRFILRLRRAVFGRHTNRQF